MASTGYIERVMEIVTKRNAGQPEFLQAVGEVLDSHNESQKTMPRETPGATSDILLTDGSDIYMRQIKVKFSHGLLTTTLVGLTF